MTNNDNQRYFPLRDPENPFKVALTPITEEQYRALYPPNAISGNATGSATCANTTLPIPLLSTSRFRTATALLEITFRTADLL